MKILYHFRTRGTGAEAVHIAGVAEALGQAGHEVIFSSPTGVDPRQTAGSNPYARTAHRSPWADWLTRAPALLFELIELVYNIPAWFTNRAIIRREGVVMIYERHAFFLFSTVLLARRVGLPFIVEVNELVGDERVREQPCLSTVARWTDRIVFRRADLIVVVSPHLKRRIEADGIAGKKILIQPNAVEEHEYAQLADGSMVRQRHQIPPAAMVVGFIGWFVPWHRLEQLIEAFANLAQEPQQLCLMLVGDGELRSNLSDQATRLGVGDRVLFMGSVPHSEIPACIAAMDVCVVPHSNEYRSPIKLFEYMAQQKAVVAPRTEPVEMVVRDGENGILFEPGSTPDLQRALTSVLADAALRRRLGQEARADVLARHTWRANATEVLQAVAKVHQQQSSV